MCPLPAARAPSLQRGESRRQGGRRGAAAGGCGAATRAVLWADGGNLIANGKSLLSAIKIIDVSLIDSTSNHAIKIPMPLYKALVSRSWTMGILAQGETAKNVKSLEANLFGKGTDFLEELKNATLTSICCGSTADNSIRAKGSGVNSKTERCPLCSCALTNDTPCAFLDYNYLIECRDVMYEFTEPWFGQFR